MEIATDGGGTVFQGQSRTDRLVVEIMDPYRKSSGANSIAEMGVDVAEDGAMHEVCCMQGPTTSLTRSMSLLSLAAWPEVMARPNEVSVSSCLCIRV